MSQHKGSHKNSLDYIGENYLNGSHWPMRRIRLLECTFRDRTADVTLFLHATSGVLSLTAAFSNARISCVSLL